MVAKAIIIVCEFAVCIIGSSDDSDVDDIDRLQPMRKSTNNDSIGGSKMSPLDPEEGNVSIGDNHVHISEGRANDTEPVNRQFGKFT